MNPFSPDKRSLLMVEPADIVDDFDSNLVSKKRSRPLSVSLEELIPTKRTKIYTHEDAEGQRFESVCGCCVDLQGRCAQLGEQNALLFKKVTRLEHMLDSLSNAFDKFQKASCAKSLSCSKTKTCKSKAKCEETMETDIATSQDCPCLPDDVIYHIVGFLDLESKMRLRLVSKGFKFIIDGLIHSVGPLRSNCALRVASSFRNLESVSLEGGGICVSKLNMFGRLKNVRIQFTNNLTDETYYYLSQLSQIESLSLFSLQSLNCVSVEYISKIPSLTSLEIEQIYEPFSFPSGYQPGLAKLKHLRITSCLAFRPCFLMMQRMTSLESLHLDCFRSSHLLESNFLRSMTNLRSLVLSPIDQCQPLVSGQLDPSIRSTSCLLAMDDCCAIDYEPLTKLTQLHTLYLRGLHTSTFCPLLHLTQLKLLNPGQGFGDEDLKRLCLLPNLHTLILHEITDVGVANLLALGLTNLTSLNLEGSCITDACLQDLAALNLNYLDISHTSITNRSAFGGIARVVNLYDDE